MNSGGVRRRVELGWGLVKGLTYLHEQKVAHRDVNTDKVLGLEAQKPCLCR
jgi:serine/threonine protein kinase